MCGSPKSWSARNESDKCAVDRVAGGYRGHASDNARDEFGYQYGGIDIHQPVFALKDYLLDLHHDKAEDENDESEDRNENCVRLRHRLHEAREGVDIEQVTHCKRHNAVAEVFGLLVFEEEVAYQPENQRHDDIDGVIRHLSV